MADPTALLPCGHPYRQAFGGGYRCSAKSCGKVRAEAQALAPIKQRMSPEELEVSRTRLAAGVPPGLTGDAATQWSKDKLVELLPRAVAQLQKDLDFGTEKVKSEAADKILKANGMDKREAAAEVSRPAIILNLNMGDSKVPWLQRIQPKGDK